MTVRARNVRSWLTSTTPALSPVIQRSSRSSPARSRSFVGSSRRNTSKRASSSAASPARAASPPDSDIVGWSSRPAREPEIGPHLADAGVEVGATERQPPVEGDGVAIVGPDVAGGEGGRGGVHLGGRRGHAGPAGEERPHGLLAARRLPGAGSRRSPSAACARRARAPGGPARRAPAAASTCRRRWGRRRRCAGRPTTTRSTASRTVRGPRVTVRSRARRGDAAGTGQAPGGRKGCVSRASPERVNDSARSPSVRAEHRPSLAARSADHTGGSASTWRRSASRRMRLLRSNVR